MTADGFRQSGYEVAVGGDLRFYNPSTEPVTICLGRDTTCDTHARGPDVLRSPGLTLNAGATTLVTFDSEGHFPITIVVPAGAHPNGIVDADVLVAPPYEDTGPDVPY